MILTLNFEKKKRRKYGYQNDNIHMIQMCWQIIYQVIWLPFSLSIRVIVLFVHSCGYRLFLHLHALTLVCNTFVNKRDETYNKQS